MRIGGREFDTDSQVYIWGILNVTPDSFSDGGKWSGREEALRHVEEMVREGADVIDIGGESTRPGYTMLSVEEEIERVVPIITAIKENFEIPISLDTYKSQVAKAGIEAGVDLINDIWGLQYDEEMAGVIAKSGLPCCLMHNRKDTDYRNFMEDVAADLSHTLHLAEQAGIDEKKIILDPGIGFAKTYEQNLEMLDCMDELKVFGCPILLGCSRKSVIGLTLDLPVTEREEGTIVTTVLALMRGASFVRVHDVKKNKRAIDMTRAIMNHKKCF